MTDHPITPPPELVQQWASESLATQNLCDRAAQWGAGQELEATLAEVFFLGGQALAARVRAARRPKPPTLAEQGLEALRSTPCTEQHHYDALFAALNRLKQLEDSND
jgi:hypothetical protein